MIIKFTGEGLIMIAKDNIYKNFDININSNNNSINIQKIMKIVFWEVDMPNQIIYFSEGFQPLFNNNFFSNGHPIKNLLKLIYIDDLENVTEKFQKFITGLSKEFEVQCRVRIQDGSYKWYRHYGLTQVDVEGKIFRILGFSIDLSYEKNLERKLYEVSNIDAATGLNNLTYLENFINTNINRLKKKASWGVLLFINVGGLKKINDTYGFNVGNKVLKAFGEILNRCVRNDDVIAKINGDEFAVLLVDIFDDCDTICIVNRILDAVKPSLCIEENEIYINLSVGITNIKGSSDETYEIIRKSHAAAYRAKQSGKNKFLFYAQEENERFIKKVNIENELRHAIENEEFELYYQPKVGAVTGNICGLEALIRWNHPVRGVISPMEFVPIAEENDLIIPIGDWVLKTACEQCNEWIEKGFDGFSVAVNISPKQFHRSDIVQRVKDTLIETGLDSKYLELEITESALIESMDKVIDAIQELRKLGVKISLDDFGTGYSSLSYLRKLPIDKIKIDRSFIKDIYEDEKVEAIISAILLLSKTMKLEIIAEGVENLQQLNFLVKKGCNQIQGYLFSRPENVVKIEELLCKGSIKIEIKK